MKRSSPLIVVALVAAAALHLSVAWQDFPTLAKNGFLYDDSFYAFQIARNIAHGLGPTFDGSTLTNGFQPLYVFLLVPLFLVAGGDPILPVHLALSMLALFTVATAWVLFRIARRYVGGNIAAFVALFWVVSPVVIRQSANGLETAVALFFFALSIDYYLGRVRNNPDAGVGAHARLGVLLGLAVLSRLDQVFLVLAMGLDYLLVLRRRGEGTAGLKRVLACGATAFAVYLPWMLYGAIGVGSALPESGAATRFLSVAYAPFFGLGPGDMIATGPDWDFVRAHIVRSVAVMKVTPITHAAFRTIEKLSADTGAVAAVRVAANVFGLALVTGVAFWLIRRSRLSGAFRQLHFLLLFSVSLVAAYSLYVFGSFFFIRYYYPVYFVATLYSAFLVADLAAWLRRSSPAVRRLVTVPVVAYACAIAVMAYNCCFRSSAVYHFYDTARWVEAHTDPDETIGVFQSGAIGYLSNRRVVNLDGKVNGDALEALRNGRLDEYIESSDIDVVFDHRKVLKLFLGFGEDGHEGLASSQFYTGSQHGAPGWVGFRVPRAQVRKGPAAASGGTP